MGRQKVDKIGVELEGGWDKVFSDAVIEHDHSVKNLPNEYILSSITGKAPKHIGEIPSKPFASLEELKVWLVKHYPIALNSTCGFHVHISLRKNLYYSQLMDRAFLKFFRSKATTWGKEEAIPTGSPFWVRLSGKNKFCTSTFIPHQQSQLIIKEQNDARRYTMFNYCFGMHGTMECRIAPMFPTAEQAFSWVKLVVETAEEWLSSRPPEKVRTFRLKTRDLDALSEVRRDYDSLRKTKNL